MEPTQLGIVQMQYKEDGKMQSAMFIPTIMIKADADLINQINTLPQKDDAAKIAHAAELVFSEWFVKTNEIELADREKFKVESNILTCEKYANGQVKECKIQFLFTGV